jgi:hypothetical protein
VNFDKVSSVRRDEAPRLAERKLWDSPSGAHKAHRQLIVTTDHQTVDPFRLALRIKCDLTRSSKQDPERVPRLDPSQWRSNAVVDASTEGDMPT